MGHTSDGGLLMPVKYSSNRVFLSNFLAGKASIGTTYICICIIDDYYTNILTFILAKTVLCEILLTRLGTAWGTEKNLEEESVPVMRCFSNGMR